MEQLRVWWNTGDKQRTFEVADMHDAIVTISALTRREVDDDTIPWNAGGLEVYNPDTKEWEEYFNDDGDDINEIYEVSEIK